MIPEYIYKPSPWQQRFHALPHDEALGAGAAGPGKSLCLLMDPLAQIIMEHNRATDPDHPHAIKPGYSRGRALHLRRLGKTLVETITRAKQIFTQFDPGFNWYESDHFGIFSSGYRYDFGHCKDNDDWIAYLSQEFSYIAYDELTEFNEEQYEKINTRLRSSDPVLREMLKIRAMSNPQMRRNDGTFTVHDPHWVRRYFVDPAPEGNTTLERKVQLDSGKIRMHRRIYLPARLSDNPDKGFVADYEFRLQSAPPHIRAALLYGNWRVTPDSFFAWIWNPQLHVVEPYRIPSYWRIFRSMDWGFKAPGCIGWFASDEEGNLIMIREYTFQGKTDVEVADRVRGIETEMGIWGRNGSMITGVADTQLWEQRGGYAKPMAQVFSDKGVDWIKADKKSREANAHLLTKRLADHGGKSKMPGITFFKTCVKTIETLPGIQTDAKNPESPQDGGEDHWLDCLAGETLVTTDRGPVMLNRLLPTDLVLSTDGGFWPCTGGYRVRENELWRVTFDDGRALLATRDHLLLCNDGIWRRVDELDDNCYAYAPWIRSRSHLRFRNSKGSATTSAGDTSRELDGVFIESSGEPQMVRFLGDTTSTTGMRTVGITRSPTWSYSPVSSIVQCTAKVDRLSNSDAGRTPARELPRHGIDPKRVEHGMLKKRSKLPRNGRKEPPRVCDARSSLVTVASGRRGRAQMPAGPLCAESLGSITRREFALPAGIRSWSTGMQVRSPVLGAARRISSVAFERIDDSWCTTVPTMGAFVASGVVVSNCVLYACAYASNGAESIPRRDDYEDEDAPVRHDPGRLGYGVNY